jgi:hypothetical protein
MKVTKIIFSSDDSHYLDFWKINSEITFKKLGVTPVLFHITDEDSDFFEDEFGLVKKIKRLTNHSDKVQSQIVRMYATKYFPNEICLTNDIDMFLFNKNYLVNNLENISDDDMVILNSDAYDSNRPECVYEYSGPDRYPICYIAAKGTTFNKILNTDVSFQEYVNRVESVGLEGHNDEIYFGRMVNNQNEIKVHKVKRGYCSNFYVPQRIEKYMFNLNDQLTFRIDMTGYVDMSYFIDCHCKSPYFENRILIDKLKEQILNE